ncbi:ATP-binding cassette domain-containing protein [Dysgonomonas sp. 25]|uniref:ABC transporter ATP-binding protein n=1 Tax=Dysgonomonas sp. 25 TaxID=2302933 RepID=UPI0013D3C902|nr:ABC transporter ATP-binding protein [Dysgonomonas sp. 25]NDV68232.1 ABC transporter ATP-binding protein [Dysgonomonas sp. 25]
MTIYETQKKELYQLLEYGNYNQLLKRIIDFTLDTDDIKHYRNTLYFIDWLERNPQAELKDPFETILVELFRTLDAKAYDEAPHTLVSIENLIRSYKNSGFALGPISFEIRERQIIGLVGENGNGKTTLLRALCGELQPTAGQIKYLFLHEDTYDLRSHLIYIPQRTATWHGSLLSNLKFAASTYGIVGEMNELTVQLIIARMGLRKYRGYKWKNLSSGYKMRFELARALLRKPKLLLIDEPLANLDILAQQIVLDDFRDIARSPFNPVGIVLSSQQLYEVEKTSDDVIFLKNGTPRNLINPADGVDVEYTEVPKFIVEFETDWNMEQIGQAMKILGLDRLEMNGGTYVASFPAMVTTESFLRHVLDLQMPLTYFRNISRSTRRFFLS